MEKYWVDEKFGKVPIGWEVKKLKDVSLNNGEYGANASALPFQEGSIRYIRITDIDDFGYLLNGDMASIEDSVASQYLLKNDDILFARTGDTVGKSLLYKETMGKAAFAGYLIKFSLNKSIVVPEYLSAVSKSNIFESFKYAMKRVGAKPNINSREYGSFRFLLPPLAEQTAIAKILSTVDEAIRSTRETISKLERVKKALMQNLLSGKMKPDGTLRPAAEFYEDEKMGLVPKGWRSVKLKEVVLRPGEYGANASAITYEEGKVRFIRITDINDDGTLSEDDKAGLDNEIAQKYLLKEDDFLFARTGDTIGKSLLYKESMGLAAFAGYLIKFTFDKQKIVPELFQLIANSEIFEAFKVSMKRVGAKPNINSREYGNFRFIIPTDIKSQKQIVKSFEPITKQITTNNKKITALESLKKSLMQQLLTGKVRVK